jgi:xanthosine utilization system XapX-like protein
VAAPLGLAILLPMRLVVLALGTLLLGTLALAAPAARATPAQPTVALVGSTPMLVKGRHFLPLEHVRVLINGSRFTAVNMKANATGGFSFPLRVGLDACGGMIVQAIGASGSHASARIRSGGCALGWPQIPVTSP